MSLTGIGGNTLHTNTDFHPQSPSQCVALLPSNHSTSGGIQQLVGLTAGCSFHPEIIGGKRDCEIDFFAGSTIRPKNLKNLKLIPR